jgi:hypothetical protein
VLARDQPMHPWFRPLHRRVLTILVCVLWLAFEAWTEPGSLWFWLVFALTAYAVVHLGFGQPPAADEPAPKG